MLNDILSDYRSNKPAGWLVVVFLISYRVGRKLFLMRQRKKIFVYPFYFLWALGHRFLSTVFGAFLPFSSELGRGVRFPHGFYGVFISGQSVIEDSCVIMHHVTIGSNYDGSGKRLKAPVIQANTFIGAGAKVIGEVVVGEGCKIGANAVVVADLPKSSVCFVQKAIVRVGSSESKTRNRLNLNDD